MNMTQRSLLTLSLLWAAPVFAQRGLKDIPNVDPEVQLQSFQVAEEFEVTLFAADPLSTEAYRWWKSRDSHERSEGATLEYSTSLRWGPASRVESIGANCGKGDPVELAVGEGQDARFGRRLKISEMDPNSPGWERLVKWAQRLLELKSRRLDSKQWDSGLKDRLAGRIRDIDRLKFLEERIESGGRYWLFARSTTTLRSYYTCPTWSHPGW